MVIKTSTKKIYFDTNVFIYLIENNPFYQEKVERLITSLDELGCDIITSELTLAECLVKPFADNDVRSQTIYRDSIKTSEFLTVKAVSKPILVEAARLRSVLKNKLPDSIHLATAMETHCDVFVGNDKKIKVEEGMELIILDSF